MLVKQMYNTIIRKTRRTQNNAKMRLREFESRNRCVKFNTCNRTGKGREKLPEKLSIT